MMDNRENVVISHAPLQRAVDGVDRLIRSRRWTEGQRLPSEEALADLFNVSRSTLRKALDDLSRRGIVRRERNRGCVVSRSQTTDLSVMSRSIVVVNDLLDETVRRTGGGESSRGLKQGLFDTADGLGRAVLLIPINSIDSVLSQQLIDAHPQGLVMLCWKGCSPAARRFASAVNQSNIPIVAYGMDDVPEAVEKYGRVMSDHESGMRKLLELLSRNGRKRVLRVWTCDDSLPWIAAHNRGYEAVADALGLTFLPPVYVTNIPPQVAGDQAAFNARTRFFAGYLAEHLSGSNPVDAIMVATDSETFNVAAACRLLGKEPGVDVLITGYDNYWARADERRFESAIPFATVDKRNIQIGQALIQVLDQRIADPLATPLLSCIEQDVVESPVWLGETAE